MRHESLPKGLTRVELAEWLRKNAVDTFTEPKRTYYTEEQLLEFKELATEDGREINRLDDLAKKIATMITKGNATEVDMLIPQTKGLKNLKIAVRENLDKVEKGYDEVDREVFAIPCSRTEMMNYFDLEGELIEERTRPLSAREINKYVGMFSMAARPQGLTLADQNDELNEAANS